MLRILLATQSANNEYKLKHFQPENILIFHQ